jgi:hypothetical protein
MTTASVSHASPAGGPDRRRLETPRAAGIAGLAFAALFVTSLVLMRVQPSAGSTAAEIRHFYLRENGGTVAVVGVYLVPFAGIAFLWFIGVVRDRIGEREDRLFATVFLGSGLLFVGMLFVAAAVAAGVLADPALEAGRVPSADLWGLGRRVTFTALNVYAIRMGAVFILSTTTIGRRTRIIPRWLVVTGSVVGLVLLLGSGVSIWVNLALPVWVLILSSYILLNGADVGSPTDLASREVAGGGGEGAREVAIHAIGDDRPISRDSSARDLP